MMRWFGKLIRGKQTRADHGDVGRAADKLVSMLAAGRPRTDKRLQRAYDELVIQAARRTDFDVFVRAQFMVAIGFDPLAAGSWIGTPEDRVGAVKRFAERIESGILNQPGKPSEGAFAAPAAHTLTLQ